MCYDTIPRRCRRALHILHRRLLAANFVCNPGKLIWGYRDSLGVPTQHFLSDPLDSFRQKVSMIKLPSLDNFSLAFMPFILHIFTYGS